MKMSFIYPVVLLKQISPGQREYSSAYKSLRTKKKKTEESKRLLVSAFLNLTSIVAGQVLDLTESEDRIHIKSRLVRFSWQRRVKIGKIQF